jgi:cytochrome d ubiquinol oxidase subunit II
MTTTVAVVLLLAIVLYGVFGGADHAIGPVWEANHTWLIFILVVLWTGFPDAFVAVMTTQYVPLGIAAFGIVVRGSGFAFRKVLVRTEQQRVVGAAFAVSSVLTPFFLGTVAGGIASGRVPTEGHGDPATSWLNPTSLLGGGLAVLTCGYLAAIFLTAEARRLAEPDLEQWARRRALVTAVLTGAVAVAGLFVLHADAHRLFDRLLHQGWPCIAVSALAGGLALLATLRGGVVLVRALGALAVASVLTGWGIGQYPYLLGTHLSIHAAAAPAPTMTALGVVTVAAAVLVGPSLLVLYVLAARGRLSGQ